MSDLPLKEQDPMEQAAQDAAEVLKALSNPARLRLLCALVPRGRTVSELESLLGARQAYVSGMLMRLRQEGYVEASRDGRTVTYELSDPRITPILERLYEVFCPVPPVD